MIRYGKVIRRRSSFASTTRFAACFTTSSRHYCPAEFMSRSMQMISTKESSLYLHRRGYNQQRHTSHSLQRSPHNQCHPGACHTAVRFNCRPGDASSQKYEYFAGSRWSGTRFEVRFVLFTPSLSSENGVAPVLVTGVHFSTRRNACGTMDTGDTRRYDSCVSCRRLRAATKLWLNRTAVCLSPGPMSPRGATPRGRWIPATSAGMTRVCICNRSRGDANASSTGYQ